MSTLRPPLHPRKLEYNPKLKSAARRLRSQMTDAERGLWARLRRNQVQSIQFYTQKTIGHCIVDFYSPKAKLVVGVDGSQHMAKAHSAADAQRDAYLTAQRLRVLRFENLQVLGEIDGVINV